jgi:hypothetical protein
MVAFVACMVNTGFLIESPKRVVAAILAAFAGCLAFNVWLIVLGASYSDEGVRCCRCCYHVLIHACERVLSVGLIGVDGVDVAVQCKYNMCKLVTASGIVVRSCARVCGPTVLSRHRPASLACAGHR